MGLLKDPTGTVTVTVTKKAGADPSLAVDTDPDTAGNQNTFTLTKSYLPADPEGHGTIEVIAGEDDDSADLVVSDAFTIAAAGDGYDGLSKSFGVNVTDNDVKGLAAFRGLTNYNTTNVLPADVAWVPEGGTLTVPVRLASRPNGTVTVTVTGINNPSNLPFSPPHAHPTITVDMDTGSDGVQDTMTFTNLNWDVPQDMVLSAAEDSDAEGHARVVQAGGQRHHRHRLHREPPVERQGRGQGRRRPHADALQVGPDGEGGRIGNLHGGAGQRAGPST